MTNWVMDDSTSLLEAGLDGGWADVGEPAGLPGDSLEGSRHKRVRLLRRLIEILILGSLTPFTRRELVDKASVVLDEHWCGFSRRELLHIVNNLESDLVETDELGRYCGAIITTSLDEAWELMVEEDAILAELEDDECSDEDETARMLQSLFAFPLLDAEQEQDLAADRQKGSGEAIERLVLSNLRLAWHLSGHYRRGDSALVMDRDDLFQEACIGLMRAAQRFEPIGNKFSTYATWWIRQCITRALADQDRTIRVPVHMIEKLHTVERVVRKLEASHAKAITEDDIAENAGIDAATVRVLLTLRDLVHIPIDDFLKAAAGMEDEVIPEQLFESDVACVVCDADFEERLTVSLKCLTPRQREVIALRNGIGPRGPLTLEEVGQRLGVSRERVRQIEARALELLQPEVELLIT